MNNLGDIKLFIDRKWQRLDDIPLKRLDEYLGWIEKLDHIGGGLVRRRDLIKRYLAEPSIAAELDRELGD